MTLKQPGLGSDSPNGSSQERGATATIFFCLMAPSFKSMMTFILINLIEIYLVSIIFAEMDITLKL